MMNKKFTPLLGDNPIQSLKEDLLDRKKVAKHFVQIVLNLDRSRGVVTSVFGPWGSGKTSFINLVTEELRQQQYNVLRFNPWMFHGTKQLIGNFFEEISAQMLSKETGASLVPIGSLVCEYGVNLSIIHTTSRILPHLSDQPTSLLLAKINSFFRKKFLKNISVNSRRLREQIKTALKNRKDCPIIVVIDDIDRLPAAEIRDVFQLVRLTASFPNLIYIVVCDRNQVEKALKKQGVSGHDYLEKIIQFPFDLPKISRIQIDKQITIALEKVLGASASPSLPSEPVYYNIILPLIRNMRDVRRYAIATQQALINFDQKIEQVDILALEAIRLFLPDVFKLLPEVIDALTIPSISLHNRKQTEHPARENTLGITHSHTSNEIQRQKLIDAGKPHGKVVQSMLRHLFPVVPNPEQKSVELLRARRVAHENILRRYLEQTVNPDLLVFNDAQRALKAMEDKATFEDFWLQREPQEWWDIIRYLKRFENEFLPKHVGPGVTVMLNLLPRMPVLPLHPYHVNQRAIIGVVLPLLRKLKNAATIENFMHKILIEVRSLSSKMALVDQISHESGTSNKLFPQRLVKGFKELLREQIYSTSSDDIAKEYESASLLHLAKFECEPSSYLYTIENSPKLTYSLLRSAQNQASGMSDPYSGLPKPQINFDLLSNLYENEERFITCIKTFDREFENLKPWFEQQGIPLDEARQTLALAREYVQHGTKISN